MDSTSNAPPPTLVKSVTPPRAALIRVLDPTQAELLSSSGDLKPSSDIVEFEIVNPSSLYVERTVTLGFWGWGSEMMSSKSITTSV